MPHDHVLQAFHRFRVRRGKKKLQAGVIGLETAFAGREFDAPRMRIERDGKLVLKVLAELLQITGRVGRFDVRDAVNL